MICLDLVWDPEQCSSCSKLFCKNCIKKCDRKTCCHCKQIFKSKKIDLILTNLLNDSIIQCKNCDEQHSYDNTKKHLALCLNPKSKCVLQCDETSFLDFALLKEHLTHKCPKSKIICEVCQQIIQRKDMMTHNCYLGYKRGYD